MRSPLLLVLLLLAACGGGEKRAFNTISRNPVSVRGWIIDVAGAKTAETYEQEIARRTQLFAASSVWVEESQFASGGIAENGAFIVLDVPPTMATLGFNAPGAETAKIELRDVPGGADVFIPNVVLENGGAKVLDPKAIIIRLPGQVDRPRPTGKNAIVAGHAVPVMETPLAQMADRRDYPDPGGFRPVATVK